MTRAEMAEMLSGLLNWTKCSDGSSLTFSDKDEIPVSYRPAVVEAGARGVLKGTRMVVVAHWITYPGWRWLLYALIHWVIWALL
ncbi:MAG: hypothetical protein RQM92_16690 [Candidatus Syntrophopropionicum ammoniitolerans]